VVRFPDGGVVDLDTSQPVERNMRVQAPKCPMIRFKRNQPLCQSLATDDAGIEPEIGSNVEERNRLQFPARPKHCWYLQPFEALQDHFPANHIVWSNSKFRSKILTILKLAVGTPEASHLMPSLADGNGIFPMKGRPAAAWYHRGRTHESPHPFDGFAHSL
jgi:hypothetical protein